MVVELCFLLFCRRNIPWLGDLWHGSYFYCYIEFIHVASNIVYYILMIIMCVYYQSLFWCHVNTCSNKIHVWSYLSLLHKFIVNIMSTWLWLAFTLYIYMILICWSCTFIYWVIYALLTSCHVVVIIQLICISCVYQQMFCMMPSCLSIYLLDVGHTR